MKKITAKLVCFLLILCLVPALALGEVKTIDNGRYGSIYSVLQLSTNEAILCTNSQLDKNGKSIQTPACDGLLIKLGAGGETVWTLRYEMSKYTTNIFTDAIELSDGTVLAGMHQYGGEYDLSGSSLDRYLLVHVSQQGEIMDEYPIENANMLFPAGDGFVGMSYGEGLNAYTFYDAQGQAKWSADLSRYAISSRGSVLAVNGGHIISGQLSDGEPLHFGLRMADENGKQLWQLDLSEGLESNERQSASHMELTDKGELLLVGAGYAEKGTFNTPDYELTKRWCLVAGVDPASGKLLWQKRYEPRERFSIFALDTLVVPQGLLVMGTARTDTQITYDLFDLEGSLLASWEEAKRTDDEILRTGYLMRLGDEIWTAFVVDVSDYNHLEIRPVELPKL